jgi:prepilin-type N-terminal cleavage/methylation domain-containing protein
MARARGYTLVEIMAVMAILAITIGIGMLSVDSVVPSFQLDRDAGDIAAILRDARSRAVIAGRTIRLELYPADRRAVYLWSDPDPEDPEAALYGEWVEPQVFASRTWDRQAVLERAVIGRDEASAGEAVALMFWPSGLCTPVRLYVRHERSPELKATIRLNPLTGLTTIARGVEEPESYELKVPPPEERELR